MRCFFFGTLMDRDVLEAAIGRAPPMEWSVAGTLEGYRRVRLVEEGYPVLRPEPGAALDGIVVDWLTREDMERILFFESIEYGPLEISVALVGGGRISAWLFTHTEDADYIDEPWDFAAWTADGKAADLEAIRLWMGFYGYCDVATANRLWDDAVAAGIPIADVLRTLHATTTSERAIGD